MRIILLLLLVLVTGCGFKDCKFDPQVHIEQQKENTKQENTDNTKSTKSIIKNLQDRAQPGAQVSCKY